MALNSVRVGVLGNPDGFYIQDLQRAAQGICSLVPLAFESLGAGLEGRLWQGWDLAESNLQSLDALIVRTMPWGSLEQIIFRIDWLHALEATGVPVVNSASSLEVAIDKFRTLSLLQNAGLPIPRTVACQTVAQAMDVFEQWGEVAVVKPMFGGEGRGIMRLENVDLAVRAFKTLTQLHSVIYLQEYIAHPGFDIRVLVMGNKTWAIRRTHPSDWRTNLSRGAIAEAIQPDPVWLRLATQAAEVVGATVAGVDLLLDDAKQPWIIEVNAVPGWKGLAETLKVDIAHDLLQEVVGRLPSA